MDTETITRQQERVRRQLADLTDAQRERLRGGLAEYQRSIPWTPNLCTRVAVDAAKAEIARYIAAAEIAVLTIEQKPRPGADAKLARAGLQERLDLMQRTVDAFDRLANDPSLTLDQQSAVARDSRQITALCSRMTDLICEQILESVEN
jgi:hypothetical protein